MPEKSLETAGRGGPSRRWLVDPWRGNRDRIPVGRHESAAVSLVGERHGKGMALELLHHQRVRLGQQRFGVERSPLSSVSKDRALHADQRSRAAQHQNETEMSQWQSPRASLLLQSKHTILNKECQTGEGDKTPMHRRTGSARLRSPEADLRPLFVSRRDGYHRLPQARRDSMRKFVFALATFGAIGAACSLAWASSATIPAPGPNYSPIQKAACGGPGPRCRGGGPGFAAPQDAGALHAAVAIGIGPGATSHFA